MTNADTPVPTTTTLSFTLTVELDFPLTIPDAAKAGEVFASQLDPLVRDELMTGGGHAAFPAGPDATPDELRRSQAWGMGRAFVLESKLEAAQSSGGTYVDSVGRDATAVLEDLREHVIGGHDDDYPAGAETSLTMAIAALRGMR